MLDINLFRQAKGGDPAILKKSQRARGLPEEIIDEIIQLDNEWIKKSFDLDELKKNANKIQKEITVIAKQKGDVIELTEKRKEVLNQCKDFEAEKDNKQKERDELLGKVGNIVHESVHVAMDEVNYFNTTSHHTSTHSKNRKRIRSLRHGHQRT